MCGIVGYVGTKEALPIVLHGLRQMEYRGYDSSGVAILDADGAIRTRKATGRIANLEAALGSETYPGTIGFGHTRWATHGGVTEENAHPHMGCSTADLS